MTSRRWLDSVLLTGAVAVTRYAFRSHSLYDLDSVNFALGMRRFDPAVHQPHPPGYFLYICLGRLLMPLLHDANLALVVLSIVCSCATVLVVYVMAVDWFGDRAARFAGILFVFSPLAWFHGGVALTYGVEALFSAFLGFLCWRIYSGRQALVVPAAFVLGISAGIRPSSLLFLGPLFLFSIYAASTRKKLAGIAVLSFTLLAWFLPMIVAGGGFRRYFGALFLLWGLVPEKTTVFNSSPATSIARAITILFIYFLAFGAASILPLRAMRSMAGDPRKRWFTMVWIAPALCFFTFIFLKFVNSGYLLLLAAPACIWLGHWAAEWYGDSAWNRPLKLAVLAACAAANTAMFLLSPLYCSYSSVRRFESQISLMRSVLPRVAPSPGTLIVGFDSHFLGYRHAGYYLPVYVTVEYPEIKERGGAQVFVMHERDTRLLSRLPAGSYSRFIFFPLPPGAAYRDYLKTVEAKLPAQDLEQIQVNGFDFVSAPISDLHLLFPDVTPAEGGVLPSRHPEAPAVNNRAHLAGQ